MNPTHIHLILNHFPIIGTLIGSAIMLFGIVKKQSSSRAIGAFIVVIMAIVAIPVMVTGEPAEESIVHLNGISKSLIHDHEEAAEKAFWMMEIAGVFSLIAFSSIKRMIERAKDSMPRIVPWPKQRGQLIWLDSPSDGLNR